MSQPILSRALVAAMLGLLAACGGGGGGGGGAESGGGGGTGGSTPLDPDVDFFLTGAAFARPVLDLEDDLSTLVNPASLYETDPLTGVALPGYPKVLTEGASLSSLASLSLAQILDPLTPQIPLIPRNAALVLEFSMPVSEASLNLLPPTTEGETNRIGSSSTIQMQRKSGGIVPSRAFVTGNQVVIIGITNESLGFESSPLVFDQTGTAVEDSTGFLRVFLSGSVGTGVLQSVSGLPVQTREDKLGSLIRPLPVNSGNSALDAIVLQTDDGTVTFNGFLPDLTSPRIIRRVALSGSLSSFAFVSGQIEFRDGSLAQLPNTSANEGKGEWANGLIEVESIGGSSQYVVESNFNSGGDAVFRLSPGQSLSADTNVGDTYTVSRSEFFEPIPPPFPSDPASLAAITVDPESAPRDPNDPQDQFNSDLRYFVRMFDEFGEERLAHWNAQTSTFLAVPPRTSLRLQFSEGMDVESFDPYESFYVADGALSRTDSAFREMRLGRTVSLDNGSVMEFQPYLEDQVEVSNSRFVGFGGTASQLRLVIRTVPPQSTIDEIEATATPEVLAQLDDLNTLGITGCINVGGRGLGLPAALLDQGDTENFFLVPASPSRGAFPPAIDTSMTFETLATSDPDYGVIVHRFLGQPLTANITYPEGSVHDTVTSGVEYNDYPPVDSDDNGIPERRFIYGPQVTEVGLNIPGWLTGAPAAVIQHLIDNNNPPKPSAWASPNGEDLLVSLGFGAGTPINSGFGARFQHVYRAGDASPSQTSFAGVTLDLVGLAWSPFNDTVFPTVLDDFELLVGLSGANRGRGPNTNQTNGIPADADSGLDRNFDCNRLEHLDNCCFESLTNSLTIQLENSPQPETTTVVQRGTPYTLSPINLFKPTNAGSTPGAFNLYLDYPDFNAGLDPFFGKEDVFSFPYDSRFPMLIEYSVGPNESPPPGNVYRFSPGILTSVLPRFRIWSQGQHPAAYNAPNWSIGIATCPKQINFLRAGEGGPLLKPGSYTSAVAPQGLHNGMPTQLPIDYISPPKIPESPGCPGNNTIAIQPTPSYTGPESFGPLNGVYDDDLCCITTLPGGSVSPETNYYYANGMLMNPLPDPTSFPGPTGQPPTFFFGYGPPPGAIGAGVDPCTIPFNEGFSNTFPNVISNEPGMTAPPSRFGDNSRYYMMWKYKKRVSVIESPTIEVNGATARYHRPIIQPPVADVDPAASLAVDFRAGRQLNFAVPTLDSGYVRSDEPNFSADLSGPDDEYTYIKFRASFGVAPNSTQPPIINSIVIPYEKLD